MLAHLIEHHAFPERPASPPPPLSSREEAKAAVAAGYARLRELIERLSEADLQSTVPAPWGTPTPLAEMLGWATSALGHYQGQLNYAQTAYGDMDPNIPPGWGAEPA